MKQLGDKVTLGEHECRISHKYLYICQNCEGRGHWEDECWRLQAEIRKATRQNRP